jgi:hypothetical protein
MKSFETIIGIDAKVKPLLREEVHDRLEEIKKLE